MGKRGPKPRYNDIPCSNYSCHHNSRTGTIYAGSHLPTEQFDRIVEGLNNGLGIGEIADSEGVNRNTVLICRKHIGMSRNGYDSIDTSQQERILYVSIITTIDGLSACLGVLQIMSSPQGSFS